MTQRDEIILAFLCGATVSGVVVAAALDHKYKAKYAQLADDEIESVKDHYRMKEMDLLETQKAIASQPKPDLDRIVENLGYKEASEAANRESEEITESYKKVMADRAEELEEREAEEEENAFALATQPEWNYDKEVAARIGKFPYVMHFEEYQQSECSHQVTITYFEGDDVLVDESDEVISKKDEVVGMDNLGKFGYGSNDPNVVYVRNPQLDVEYEILLHKGHYAKEILGLNEEPNLEHSAIPRRRMKFDDGTT